MAVHDFAILSCPRPGRGAWELRSVAVWEDSDDLYSSTTYDMHVRMQLAGNIPTGVPSVDCQQFMDGTSHRDYLRWHAWARPSHGFNFIISYAPTCFKLDVVPIYNPTSACERSLSVLPQFYSLATPPIAHART